VEGILKDRPSWGSFGYSILSHLPNAVDIWSTNEEKCHWCLQRHCIHQEK